jgi:hypothetical protein
MSSQVTANLTLSGKTGPALTISSASLPGVSRLDLDFAASRGTAYLPGGVTGSPKKVEFDLVLTTTLTDTITSLVNAITVAGT